MELAMLKQAETFQDVRQTEAAKIAGYLEGIWVSVGACQAPLEHLAPSDLEALREIYITCECFMVFYREHVLNTNDTPLQ